MGDTKNLKYQEAVDKIKELAEKNICLFCTYENDKIVSRPMGTQAIDDDGTIWFISKKGSTKNTQIGANHKVSLMYIDQSKEHYLSLSGNASILYDKKKIEELWNPIAKVWFTGGKDDPEITLIKVVPEEGHYWDTKNGKLVSLIKIATAALTGKQMDGGIEGDLDV